MSFFHSWFYFIWKDSGLLCDLNHPMRNSHAFLIFYQLKAITMLPTLFSP